MKKTLIAALLFSPIIANAATVTNITPQTKTVVISAPNAFTHVLTPVTGLTAGSVPTGGREVATGEVKPVSGGSPAQYAVQFATGGNNTVTTAGVTASIKGSTNASNLLTVALQADNTMTGTATTQTVSGSSWLVYPSSTSFKYVVNASNTTINADSYPITVNAAVYTP
ncbi:hypothetical protein SPG90_21640 (plasmid) [Enterobacter sp. D2]|uniref:hypothetical protein n=1 Tax=Enterobacter sp. D2 TaxID=3102784 RepID=UPI002ACAACC7|nr:hypothetical protein [Enterobacter sp. D2]MDZ5731095.1 hypothetical protein [Enterobacter sp. D2]